MSFFHVLAERIRRGEPIPAPVAALLSAATPLTRLAMARRLSLPRSHVNAHVISFGNITAGGTGKTPAVIERARRERDAGAKVAVLTRGYGARSRRPSLLVTSGPSAVSLVGDEPALIARKVPGIVIVKDPDRVAGARCAIEDHGCDTLLLDDGFQYVRLERDENVLLIDASNPWGNGRLIPRGILREPLEHATRATHIILTRCDQAEDLPSLLEQLGQLCPETPVRKTCHAPTALWRVADGAALPLETIRGKAIKAVCGIGNPEAFFRTLDTLGAVVADRCAYPDHAAIPAHAFTGPDLVVTTEKDAVRVVRAPENVVALGIELRDWA